MKTVNSIKLKELQKVNERQGKELDERDKLIKQLEDAVKDLNKDLKQLKKKK